MQAACFCSVSCKPVMTTMSLYILHTLLTYPCMLALVIAAPSPHTQSIWMPGHTTTLQVTTKLALSMFPLGS